MDIVAHNIFEKLAQAFARSSNAARSPSSRITATGSTALGKKSLLKIDNSLGRRVCCDSGAVWITLDHDVRDTVLEAGQSFVSDRTATMIITALNPATIRIE